MSHHSPDTVRQRPSVPVVPPKAYIVQWRTEEGRIRQSSLPKTTLYVLCGLFGFALLWAVAVTAYIIYHDEFVLSMRQSWAKDEQSYEDRIANLSGMLDRVTSRQMVERETLERKVDLLLKRQAIIETRQSIVGQVLDSVGLSRPVKDAAQDAKGQRHSALRGEETMVATVDALIDRLDSAEKTDLELLAAVEGRAADKSRRLRSVFAELGVAPAVPLAARSPAKAAMGGPFVPLTAKSGAFDQMLERLQGTMTEVDGLQRAAGLLPLARPVAGETDQTSGYGARLDPFMKTWAMHAGIDFRGNTGDPIRVTAMGRVVHAGWQGGYGNMVEVEHSNGLSTRYGHMSQIDVSVGDNVRVGQVIGRIGSTGRSTGPHLHYETRVDGEAVDPTRFLRAAAKLN